MITRPGHTFAHATATYLSLHVQHYDWSGYYFSFKNNITGDPLHSRALTDSRAPLFTQPCPHCSHSRAPGEQWARLCVFTLQGCVQAARLCRGSPVNIHSYKMWIISSQTICEHDDVIKWKHFPRSWPFVRGIHRSPVNSPHKGQWRGALMFSLICAWINGQVNNREAGLYETPSRPRWRHCNGWVPGRHVDRYAPGQQFIYQERFGETHYSLSVTVAIALNAVGQKTWQKMLLWCVGGGY